MTPLTLARDEAAGIPVLRLNGRLTLGDGARSLRTLISEIAGEGHKYILLDLGGLSYIDSSGLGSLVAGYNSLKLNDGTIGLFRVPKRVHEMLEMTRLTTVFRTFETEQEAAAPDLKATAD